MISNSCINTENNNIKKKKIKKLFDFSYIDN